MPQKKFRKEKRSWLAAPKEFMIPKILAEMIGTFAIIFFGIGTLLLTERFPQTVPAYSVPLVFGGVVWLMIVLVGPISGAHFNPAVTLALVAAKRVPGSEIVLYWSSQLVGGLIAIGFLAILQK
jgi:aquaporin Z